MDTMITVEHGLVTVCNTTSSSVEVLVVPVAQIPFGLASRLVFEGPTAHSGFTVPMSLNAAELEIVRFAHLLSQKSRVIDGTAE